MFGLVGLVAILFVTDWIRIDMVACLVLICVGILQIIPNDQLFAGFGSDAVIALIGVMIIGAGLERSGLMIDVASWISKRGRDDEKRVRLLLMLVGGLSAGLMRGFGSVSLLLPVVNRISKRMGVSTSRFLLPMGYCAILGSMTTMLGTSPLILLNSLMEAQQLDVIPFGLLDVLPIGLCLLTFGVLYFHVAADWLLPPAKKRSDLIGSALQYFYKTYHVGGAMFELTIPPKHRFVGMELADLEQEFDRSLALLGFKLNHRYWLPPLRRDAIQPHMVLAVTGPEDIVKAFAKKHALPYNKGYRNFADVLNPAVSGVCEVVIPPSSELLGQSYRELHMRRTYGANVLAINRGGKIYRGPELKELTLRPGDTLGMYCEWQRLAALEQNSDYAVVSTDYPREVVHRKKIPYAVGFTMLGMVLILGGWASLPVGLLVTAVGMVFSGVLSIDEAYAAVSWRNVFLLAGLMPLGIGLNVTGGSEWLAEHLFFGLETWPLGAILVLLGVLSTISSLLISNIGATILLVPLAMTIALNLGEDPRMFALMVAVGASNNFLIPTNQAAALIAGPGHYLNRDFIRAGSALSIVYLIIISTMLPLFYA